jgi:hypothetical protein
VRKEIARFIGWGGAWAPRIPDEKEEHMKKTWKEGVGVLAVVALMVLGIEAPSSAWEANTIDELVTKYNDKKCQECHPEIYEQWQHSDHANPINSSLKGMRNFFQIGVREEWDRTPNRDDVLKCLACHAPVVKFASETLALQISDLIVTAFEKKGTPEGDAASKELGRLHVGCTACHNIKANDVAKGFRGEPLYGVVYGPTGAESDGHQTIRSPEIKISAYCMQCHGIYTAPDGETIYCNTLSGSYENAYVNMGGAQRCHDCHMHKKGRGHSFPGGHDLEIVAEGIDFQAEIARYRHMPGAEDADKRWTPAAVVTVFIQNKAGHRIPDG